MPGSRSVDRPSLVVGGRAGGSGPAYYFVHDVRSLEEALAQLRTALVVGTIVLILLALLVARVIARGVLAPVEAAGRAAERIERGDLSARVPVTSNDEFGTWAERFNRMAAALADTIGRLETAETRNRAFVADVAHELRTPLAALVAEASILREHLDDLPVESRRAGELLVADVGRMRTLVDDLMEVSRFDAGAEQIAVEPVDLGGSSGRSPRRGCPRRRSICRTDRSSSTATRAGWSGSSATCSTTPGSMPPARRSTCPRRDRRRRDRARGLRRRAGRPARPPRAHLRALLQGRPVAPWREQRAGSGDRRRARRAARRLPHRREPGDRGGLRIELRLPVT